MRNLGNHVRLSPRKQLAALRLQRCQEVWEGLFRALTRMSKGLEVRVPKRSSLEPLMGWELNGLLLRRWSTLCQARG